MTLLTHYDIVQLLVLQIESEQHWWFPGFRCQCSSETHRQQVALNYETSVYSQTFLLTIYACKAQASLTPIKKVSGIPGIPALPLSSQKLKADPHQENNKMKHDDHLHYLPLRRG